MSGETLQDVEPLYLWLPLAAISCEHRAEDADSVIHPTMERPFKLVRGTFYCSAWLPC